MTPILEIDNIHTYYGLSHILFDVSLQVEPGQVVCLLGRNGAGKTTTLKSIMGLAPPSRGQVRFRGREVTHPEIGERILARLAEDVAELGTVEVVPKMEGRNMTMQIAPEKKRRKKAPDAEEPAPQEQAATADE